MAFYSKKRMKATLIKYCGSVENNVELLPRQSADVCKFDTFARLVEEELKNAGHPYNGYCAACGAPVVAPKVYCNFRCRAKATEKERSNTATTPQV